MDGITTFDRERVREDVEGSFSRIRMSFAKMKDTEQRFANRLNKGEKPGEESPE